MSVYYETTFPCGDYICQLIYDGPLNEKNYFTALWWTDIPQSMTGPMQIEFDAACQQLFREAYIPYDPSTIVINSCRSPKPLNAIFA